MRKYFSSPKFLRGAHIHVPKITKVDYTKFIDSIDKNRVFFEEAANKAISITHTL